MAFCSKCGSWVEEGAAFCNACGAPQGYSAQQQVWGDEQQFHPQDIENNKAMAILSYLGILVLIPLFAAKESKFARFHVNQGLILFIAEVAYGIVYGILSAILLGISWRLYFATRIIGILGIVFLVLSIMGIVNAVNGRAKELPVIGKFKILK